MFLPRRSSRLITLVLGALLFVVACDAGVAPPTAPARPTAEIDASAWVVAMCQASDQVSLAIVDPATGRPSAAWNEFQAAVAAGDEAEIDATGNAVLGHLGQAASSANEALAFEPGYEAAVAWVGLVAMLQDGVRTIRDATNVGDAARANEGRAAIQQAVEVTYPAAATAMRAVELGGEPLPCG